MKLKQLTKEQVSFTVEVELDDTPIRGNVLATDDPEQDRAAEDEIIQRVNRGETHAWCIISVTAHWKNFSATASLGGNSFEKSTDVPACIAEHELKEEALNSLNEKIASSFKALATLIQD